MKKTLLLAATAILTAFTANAVDYWQWTADSGAALGTLQVQSPDGKAAVYKPQIVSSSNYVDVASVPVSSDNILTYSCEYKIPADMKEGNFMLSIVFFDERGVPMRGISSKITPKAEGWQELQKVFRPEKNAKSMLLRVINTGTDPVWIKKAVLRDATVYEQEKVPTFAGTFEEKLILHSHIINAGEDSYAVCDYNNPAPGDPYSIKFYWDNTGNTRGIFDVGSAMEVLPDPNRRLEKMEFMIRVTRNSGSLDMLPCVTVGDINHCADNVTYPAFHFTTECPPDGQWKKFEYVIPENKNISDGSFLLRIYGTGETAFNLGLPKFYYSDGTTATGFRVWDDPLWKFPDWSAKPFFSACDDTEGMIMCDTGQATQAGARGKNALLELKRMFPNLANDLIYAIGQALDAREWYEENGIPIVYQNIPNELWQLGMEIDPNILCFDPDSYRGTNEHLHKFNAAHPAWRTIYGAWADRMKDYGIPEVMSIDCIFQFGGDDSQYEPWYREFLYGNDEGFGLKDREERQFFADYFYNYAGFYPTPEFFGWNSWDEYSTTPVGALWNGGLADETRRRGWLDVLLRHYAFMMYNTRLGEELGKRGINYFLMNNGDNWQNGNDWQMNAKAWGIPGFVEETFFYHPKCVFHSVTDAMAFREFYSYYGSKHRLIQEDGQGGHNNPYWDVFNTFAMVSAMCAATPYHSLQVDWPFESCMVTLSDGPHPYHLPRYNTFVSMASAYNSQREIGTGAIRESTRRTIALHENQANIAAFQHHLHQLSNCLTYGPWFASNASFNLWDLPYVQDAKVLFNDYYALPAYGAEKLLQWLADAPDRSLVLTGCTAGKTIDGTYWAPAMGWDVSRLNAPDQFENVIGTISQEGNRYYASVYPDEVVIADNNGNPLLGIYHFDGNRKIYFYSGVPGEDPAMDKKVVDTILTAEFGEPTYRDIKGDTKTYIYDYDDGSTLFCLFSNEAMERFQMNDPRVLAAGRYEFKDDLVDNLVESDAYPGSYILYSFMNGTETPVTVAEDCKINLPLTGQATELYYLIPAENTEKLEMLKSLRASWQEKLK